MRINFFVTYLKGKNTLYIRFNNLSLNKLRNNDFQGTSSAPTTETSLMFIYLL